MQRTQFAGLTVIESGESIYVDNGSFLDRNIRTIDKLLQFGPTHVHDGHPPINDPTTSPTAVAVASGGALPPGTVVWTTYSVVDGQGGETLTAPAASAITAGGLQTPATGPAAAVDYTGGELRADVFRYTMTVMDGRGGETPPSPFTEIQRQPGYASGRVTLSGLATLVSGAGGAGWRLYRAAGGGAWGFMASGVADSFVDDGLTCIDCTQIPPDDFVNSTNQANRVDVRLPGSMPAGASFIRLYASVTTDFLSPSLVGQYPVASAGAVIPVTNFALQAASPVPQATTMGGARKINPDLELDDFHWLRPVASAAALPSAAASGDVRLSLDDLHLHGYKNGSWQDVAGGGGGGGGGALARQALNIPVTGAPTDFINPGETRVVDASALGKTILLLGLSMNPGSKDFRVRLYQEAAHATYDIDRPPENPPDLWWGDQNYVILDREVNNGDTPATYNPPLAAAALTGDALTLSVTNLGATTVNLVSLDATVLTLEA
jgi:hypothetical protein